MVINILDVCSFYAVNNTEKNRHKSKLIQLIGELINFCKVFYGRCIVVVLKIVKFLRVE